MSKKDFVVIGGGASGMVFLIYFAKFAKEKKVALSGISFHLIDPDGFGNGGIAYGKCAPGHILNTRRNEISPWEEGRFKDFLIGKGRIDDDLHFDLRKDCLEFLQTELNEALEVLERLGGEVVTYTSKVFVKKSEGETFTIVDENQKPVHESLVQLPVSHIILTVGYGPNTNFQELKQYIGAGYIHSLYPYENIKNEPALKKENTKIAVAGSAAALYDFVISCPCEPKDTTLYIFSDSGDKPQEVRQVEIEHTLKAVDLQPLLQLGTDTSEDDLEKAINNILTTGEKDAVGPQTWIAFNIMNVIGTVLNNISEQTAINFRTSQFFQKIKRLGNPTSSVAAKMLEKFNFHFVPVNLNHENIKRLEDGTFQITAARGKYIVDCIVNATGHGRHNSEILEKMKQDGLAEINPKTGVLATDESGYRLTKSHIACIGPATHFGTDGIQTFAKPAEKLAKELIQNEF